MYHLDFIVSFLQGENKNRFFLKLDNRYADYLLEYSSYFERGFISLKYLYGMTNSGNLFSYESKEWFLEAGFIQYEYQMSLFTK